MRDRWLSLSRIVIPYKLMCVLRVSSSRKSLSAFLAGTRMPYYESHDKADPQKYGRDKGKPYGDSGFKSDVSKAGWSDLETQARDAIRFLKRYRADLIRLRSVFRVSDVQLDFPYDPIVGGHTYIHFQCLPSELIRRAGALGMAIELSFYPNSKAHATGSKKMDKHKGGMRRTREEN